MYRFIWVFVTASTIAVPNLHPDTGLNIIQLATKYGYPIESHDVETDDGYILTLHRIPHGIKNVSTMKYPVLLMHGLLSSSVDWVNMGPENALGLLLADCGYDVWLGNQRGNTWSRKHLTLDPDIDAEKFFDFSFHEIGIYDIPAKIDYIINATNKEQIFYVGHSQGTTSFFVMASEKPEYNAKIRLMTALSPVAHVANVPNPFLAPLVDNYDLVKTVVPILKIHEVLPHFDYFTDLGNVLCSKGSPYQDSCVWFINAIVGFDWQIDPDFVSVITSNTPAGCSIKQLMHFIQGAESGYFAQYDYGVEVNKIQYGQEMPPLYDITKITARVSLYYAGNDWLNAVEDVLRLAEELPNLASAKQVRYSQFNHLDFLWARNVVDLLYNDVIAEITAES
ncbi:hypothetical protein Zmor_010141 [Zophobas morio]|uniref:Lipase n=1 Tax=Zophobas morio TaxID=2755281 RepID=A0AA38MJN0_9CUCU|nr:hypothetical protein Zmor_010141 [Zophobas morio]